MIKVKPILFSGAMVRALLDGSKTQTRRVMKLQPIIDALGNLWAGDINYGQHIDGMPHLKQFTKMACPHGDPGDLLYVRESLEKAHEWGGIGYSADDTWLLNSAWQWEKNSLPSIHMPRYLSRLTLEITGVRVERIQDIVYQDCISEGIEKCGLPTGYLDYKMRIGSGTHYFVDNHECPGGGALMSYISLWESINGDESWDKNPWVWVIEFKSHKKNIDEYLKEIA